MNKNIKNIYYLELIIFIYGILFKLVLLNRYLKYINMFNILFWSIILFIFIKRFHIQSDKSYQKQSSIRIIIISLFAYIIIIYSMGLFVGFSKFPYSNNLLNIFFNIIPIFILIIIQEIIRYIIARNSEFNIKPLFFYGLILVFINFVYEFNYLNFHNLEELFNFICVIILPIIAKQSLYCFLTMKISLIPSIIMRLSFELYPFIVPFFPNLSNYLTAVLGITFPFIIFTILNKYLHYHDKPEIYISKISKNLFIIPIFIFLSCIIILVSGLFSHKMIAIGSNSMNPTYNRGDTIIYKKKDDLTKINIGDILVFTRNNVVVTHRITKIIKNGKKIIFKTKGDANLLEDSFDVEENEVLGIVQYKIKYIGYPTILINELLKK